MGIMDYTYNQNISTINTIDNKLCLQVDYEDRQDFYHLPSNVDIATLRIRVVDGHLYTLNTVWYLHHNDIYQDTPMFVKFFDSDIGIQTIDTYEVETDVGKFNNWDFNVKKITIYNLYDIDCGCRIMADLFYDDSEFDNDNDNDDIDNQ
jgi:hypothetical protein